MPKLRPQPQFETRSTLMNEKVLKTLTAPGKGFDRAGLLQELFSALEEKKGTNGQRALAEIMVDEFFAAKAGSISRQRILDSWCRLVNWHSDDVHAIPIEEMTEEELIHAIEASLPRLKVIAAAPVPKRRRRRRPMPDPEPETPSRPASVEALDFTGFGSSEAEEMGEPEN